MFLLGRQHSSKSISTTGFEKNNGIALVDVFLAFMVDCEMLLSIKRNWKCSDVGHDADLVLFIVLVSWPHTKTPKCDFRNAVSKLILAAAVRVDSD